MEGITLTRVSISANMLYLYGLCRVLLPSPPCCHLGAAAAWQREHSPAWDPPHHTDRFLHHGREIWTGRRWTGSKGNHSYSDHPSGPEEVSWGAGRTAGGTSLHGQFHLFIKQSTSVTAVIFMYYFQTFFSHVFQSQGHCPMLDHLEFKWGHLKCLVVLTNYSPF